MRPVYVLSAVRTPIGKFGGAFASLSPADLGVAAARGALDRSGLPREAFGETVFGHARQAGGGPNTARQVSHGAGIPDSVPAYTVNKACASSLKALTLGALSIAAGEQESVLVGGTECMSATPYLLPRVRFGMRMGHGEVVDAMYRDGFLCPLCGELMGQTAETLARELGISRPEQDAFALESQRGRAPRWPTADSTRRSFPSRCREKGARRRFARRALRGDTTMESLARLPPVFDRKTERCMPATPPASPTVPRRSFSPRKRRRRAPGSAARARRRVDVGGRRAGAHGNRARPRGARPARQDRPKARRDRAVRAERGVCRAGTRLPRHFRSICRASTSTAGRSPSAIRSAPPARGSRRRCSTRWSAGARTGIATLCISGGMGMAVLFERRRAVRIRPPCELP